MYIHIYKGCHVDTVKTLMECGASAVVNQLGSDRSTPLLHAVKSNQADAVVILLQNGADLSLECGKLNHLVHQVVV